MAPNLQIPNLKNSVLKQIAYNCGLQTSGTKTVLRNRLQHELTSTSPLVTKPMRILSIDMGIRNLAYCILDLVPAASTELLLPTMQSWHRLAVSTAPKKSIDGDEDGPLSKEAFDPATLSTAAYTLLRKRLLIQNPTHILIERQRFRSMGSKHILEWTLRVNMFESILYATLHSLKAEGLWDGEVIPVTPGRVGPFWVVEDKGERDKKGKVRKTTSNKTKNKGAKIDLVRSWLEYGGVVELGNKEVVNMAKAYCEKWDRAPGGMKGGKMKLVEGEEKMGKLDDLADCLLQGMAWVQWEKNKRLVLKHGAEVLLDPLGFETSKVF